jgi:hypothetical protein
MFDVHPMTELYYYNSYLISSSLKQTVQHRWRLDELDPSWAKREGLALNNGYSFTVLSLSVSWQLILARHYNSLTKSRFSNITALHRTNLRTLLFTVHLSLELTQQPLA